MVCAEANTSVPGAAAGRTNESPAMTRQSQKDEEGFYAAEYIRRCGIEGRVRKESIQIL
jgi:hypothetical protein